MEQQGFNVLLGTLAAGLLTAAAVGGGMQLFQIKIPEVRRFSRFACAVLGLFFGVAAFGGTFGVMPAPAVLGDVRNPTLAPQPATPTIAPVATATAAPAVSKPVAAAPTATAAQAPTATPAPPPATATPVVAPVVATIPTLTQASVPVAGLHQINAGPWPHAFTVQVNTCPFGWRPGQSFQLAIELQNLSRPGFGLIADGERVQINIPGSPPVYSTLGWPYLVAEYTISLPYAGSGRYTAEFFSMNNGRAVAEETYFGVGGQQCVVVSRTG